MNDSYKSVIISNEGQTRCVWMITAEPFTRIRAKFTGGRDIGFFMVYDGSYFDALSTFGRMGSFNRINLWRSVLNPYTPSVSSTGAAMWIQWSGTVTATITQFTNVGKCNRGLPVH